MQVEFSETALLRMSELVAARLGLRFAPDRWPELARGIAATCAELGVADVEAWVDCVLGGLPTVGQLQALARHLTTGESYFFRQPEVFRFLAEQVMPELIAARRSTGRQVLRFWVAGCSTGEEAYSTAIMVREAVPDLPAWDVTIYANDINPAALAKASAAAYSEWSFRTTPAAVRDKYFRSAGPKRWVVAPEVRRLVRFSYLNLADADFPPLFAVPGMFDVILCRNVLMYFAAERHAPVLKRLGRALAADGRLVLGPCDATLVVHEFLEREPACPTVFRAPRIRPVAPEPAWADIGSWPAPPARSPETEPAPAEPAGAAAPPDQVPAPALAEAARVAADAGAHEEALRLCDSALGADKLNPALHFLRGSVLIELGRLTEAEAALRSVLYLDPEFVVAHFALGSLAQQQGQASAARHHFRRAEQLLEQFHHGETVPWSDGLTAGRLQSSIPAADRIAR